jgi:mRNA interferase RelE/StbE
VTYTVTILRAALKQLEDLPREDRRRIAASIDSLADDPRPPGCEKLRREDGLWRVRVGRYRVIYRITDSALELLVVRVGHRSQVYRKTGARGAGRVRKVTKRHPRRR